MGNKSTKDKGSKYTPKGKEEPAAASSSKSSKGSKGAGDEKRDENYEKDAVRLLDKDVKRSIKKVSQDDFDVIKTVGKGSFGRVFMVKKKDTKRVYAMKVLKKEKVIARNQLQHTLSERKILSDISNPFLVGLRFAFQTTQKLFMVFDFFNGGELYSYISRGRFTEERSRFYTAEILLGIEALHKNNVVYRDLKPENLLLDKEGHIRICDFGLSKEDVVGDTVKSICGTPEYLAPEVIRRQQYGKVVDWWSLGTLIWEMIVGLPPFYDTNRQKMYRKILDCQLVQPKIMSTPAYHVCSGMLERVPTKRLGYKGAGEIKAMPWFADINWDKLLKMEIEPPFKPAVKGDDDVSAVDEVFLTEPAAISATPAGAAPIAGGEKFDGFTFVVGGEVLSVSEGHALE